MNIQQVERAYIPAAGHHWSLPLYDPFTRLIGVDRARKRLLEQAQLRAGHRVLDIGCGTGSLAVLMKSTYPDVYVTAIDPDPRALARGRRKAERAGLILQFDRGFSEALPYAEASFDRVFSSFVFHHLQGDVKIEMLREARRVLRPGGRLELLDFAGPDAGSDGVLLRLLHSHRFLQDNTAERVLALIHDAGLSRARRAGEGTLLVGRIAYYQASREA